MQNASALSQAEKLRLIEAAVNANLPHSVMRLFILLVDNPAALQWSTERLAKALKRSVRLLRGPWPSCATTARCGQFVADAVRP